MTHTGLLSSAAAAVRRKTLKGARGKLDNYSRTKGEVKKCQCRDFFCANDYNSVRSIFAQSASV